MHAKLNTPLVKHSLHMLGSLLSLLSLAFLGYKLYQQSAQLHTLMYGGLWWMFTFSAVCYAMALGLLAHAWRTLLQYLGVNAPTRPVWRIYASSQLSKYIPGNVFQFVSRQLQGAAIGLPHAILLRSSMLEVSGLVLGALLPGLLVLPRVAGLYGWGILLLLLLVMWLLMRQPQSWLPPTHVWLFYLLFHVLAGLMFVWLVLELGGHVDSLYLPILLGAYLLAWLAGFVTPGAPGGIGVREMVLMLLLKGVVADAMLLQAIIVSRLMTTCGDLLFFAAVHAVTRHTRQQV